MDLVRTWLALLGFWIALAWQSLDTFGQFLCMIAAAFIGLGCIWTGMEAVSRRMLKPNGRVMLFPPTEVPAGIRTCEYVYCLSDDEAHELVVWCTNSIRADEIAREVALVRGERTLEEQA